jgi:sugar lactone lactonase YvrE
MHWRLTILQLGLMLALPIVSVAAEPQWISARAYEIPPQTTSEGSGYFSIIPGKDGRLYIGTAKYRENAFLVAFDPREKKMEIVVDAHREIRTNARGFAAQAKIHTRNNIGPSGRIYFGTKQGYPKEGEQRSEYLGGYPMVYDPRTQKTRVYPIPVPHQGIISVTPDESRNVAYISTCSDARPVESTHFMVLDLETGKYRDLLDCQHMYAFIVVDHLGRAYHPILGGDIARYDPRSDKLERIKQTIDGQPPSAESLLADPQSHPINWDISPDGKTLFAVAMSGNQLYSYDLTGEGDTLAGRSLGKLLPDAEKTDCRGMCVGPRGTVWAAVWGSRGNEGALHLVRKSPTDAAPRDLGAVSVSNPDYTPFVDADGKPLPYHHGFRKTPEGVFTPLYHMGIAETEDGRVYMLVIDPYTVLEFDVPK